MTPGRRRLARGGPSPPLLQAAVLTARRAAIASRVRPSVHRCADLSRSGSSLTVCGYLLWVWCERFGRAGRTARTGRRPAADLAQTLDASGSGEHDDDQQQPVDRERQVVVQLRGRGRQVTAHRRGAVKLPQVDERWPPHRAGQAAEPADHRRPTAGSATDESERAGRRGLHQHGEHAAAQPGGGRADRERDRPARGARRCRHSAAAISSSRTARMCRPIRRGSGWPGRTGRAVRRKARSTPASARGKSRPARGGGPRTTRQSLVALEHVV